MNTIYLVGNPNSGKTSVFNGLTGLRQKVGNFPGVTVDKKQGVLSVDNTSYRLVDLPGIYGLQGTSLDEKVTVEEISNINDNSGVLFILDPLNLKRNLHLLFAVKKKVNNILVVVNMMDLLALNDMQIDLDLLAKEIGLKVIPYNARIGKGKEKLLEALPSLLTTISRVNTSVDITKVVSKVLTYNGKDRLNQLTQKIDRILLHGVYGYMIFFSMLFIFFQLLFSLAAIPMEYIDQGVHMLTIWLRGSMPHHFLTDLLIDGLIAGIGGVVIFVPQISLLFAFIFFLESTGYMSRVSFLMDRIVRVFGLNGRAVVPLMGSLACAVPSIMGARTIANSKERIITILVAPLVSCSARLPVYLLLVSLFIDAESTFFGIHLQGLVLFGLYLLGFLAVLLTALLLKIILKNKEITRYVMEMPIYRWPRWSTLLMDVAHKVKLFLWDAGKVIVLVSILLWGLSSYGPPKLESQGVVLAPVDNIENSYIGKFGTSIEPVIRPLGYDWKVGVAIITSFAAREVFVGTMATLYRVDEENVGPLIQRLKEDVNEITGKKTYGVATAVSLLLFYVFALQCMSTVVITHKETGSYMWPIIQFVYMGALAYISAYIAYNLLV